MKYTILYYEYGLRHSTDNVRGCTINEYGWGIKLVANQLALISMGRVT